MNYLGKDVELKVVGTRPIRPDGVEKVIGRAAFGADFRVAGISQVKKLLLAKDLLTFATCRLTPLLEIRCFMMDTQ